MKNSEYFTRKNQLLNSHRAGVISGRSVITSIPETVEDSFAFTKDQLVNHREQVTQSLKSLGYTEEFITAEIDKLLAEFE